MLCSIFFLASTASSCLTFRVLNWPNIASFAAKDMSCADPGYIEQNVLMKQIIEWKGGPVRLDIHLASTLITTTHDHILRSWVKTPLTLWILICSASLLRSLSWDSYSCLRTDDLSWRPFRASISASSSLFFDSSVRTYNKTNRRCRSS